MKILIHPKYSLISLILFIMLLAPISFSSLCAWGDEYTVAEEEEMFEDELLLEEEANGIADPLEPLNRVFFQVNDKLYFWVLKPVATGYKHTVAEDIRISVRDFFYNLLSPVRIINNLLQGKVKESGTETARFLINTTLGVAGFGDPAKNQFGLDSSEEDFGQTLGKYGVGEGIYIVWPVFGPSNIRDTLGMGGDFFMSPLTYISQASTTGGLVAKGTERVNDTSLKLGDYEQFKESSFDPYLALRDAYRQYRNHMIYDEEEKATKPAYSGLTDEEVFDKDPVGSVTYQSVAGPADENTTILTGDQYYVHVGTFIDLQHAQQLQDKLTSLQTETILAVYDRGDYRLYGVQVRGGEDFGSAKKVEEFLVSQGFSETIIVHYDFSANRISMISQ